MAKDNQINFRVNDPTKEAINEFAEERDYTQAEAVRRMVEDRLAGEGYMAKMADGGVIHRLDELERTQQERLDEIDQKVEFALEDEPSTLEKWVSGMSVWASGLTLAAAVAYTVSTVGLVGGINSDLAFWTTAFGALLMLLFLYVEDLIVSLKT